MLSALLGLSRLIDAVTAFIGRQLRWLILATVLISAGNAILRKAFAETFTDPDFLAEMQKAQANVLPMSGDDMQKAVQEAYGLPEATIQRIRDILAD